MNVRQQLKNELMIKLDVVKFNEYYLAKLKQTDNALKSKFAFGVLGDLQKGIKKSNELEKDDPPSKEQPRHMSTGDEILVNRLISKKTQKEVNKRKT